MKTHAPRVCLVALLLILGGCAHSVTTAPARPAETNNGVTYALPRTRLDLSLTYTVRKKVTFKDSVAVGKPEVTYLIQKPATVTPVIVPDEKNRFIISGDGLAKDGRLDATFKFAVDENQLLTSVSADLTDKTPEIFQSIVGAAVSYAKFAAVAGDGTSEKSRDPVEADYSQRIAAIDREIVKVSGSGGKDRLDVLKGLAAERVLLVNAWQLYQEANQTVTTDKDIPYIRSIAVADLLAGPVTIKPPPGLFGLKNDNTLPVVTITLLADAAQKTNARTQLFQTTGDKEKEGVYFRVPSRARLLITDSTIANQPVTLFDTTLALPELGPIDKVEARYKRWAKRKTTITFNKTTGSISEYGVETTSSGQAATKALETSFGKVQETAAALQKQKDDAAAKTKTAEDLQLADLQQQQKLLEAELAILKAKKAIAKETTNPTDSP